MRVLKKILLWLLLVAVLAALIVGGAVAWFYYNTDPEAFDAPAVTAGGTALAVNGYEWNAPVMGGVLFKSASAPATLETQDLGTWEQASLDITLPADRPTHLVVKDASGNVLLDVNNEAQVTVAFPANGKYTLEADVTVPRPSSADKPGAPAHGYGVFRYSARVNVSAQPKVEFSSTRVEQGAVVTVLLTGFLDGPEPSVETDLSLAQFCDVPGGKAAFIGVHYNREPGDYTVRVTCGSVDVTQTVTVVHRDFPKQNMTIDQSVADATVNSAAAWYLYSVYFIIRSQKYRFFAVRAQILILNFRFSILFSYLCVLLCVMTIITTNNNKIFQLKCKVKVLLNYSQSFWRLRVFTSSPSRSKRGV